MRPKSAPAARCSAHLVRGIFSAISANPRRSLRFSFFYRRGRGEIPQSTQKG